MFIIVVFLISTLISPSLSYAQNTSDEDIACRSEYVNFLTSLLSSDEADEYWKDYLVRNRCQQQDIFALENDISELNEQLRDEFYDGGSCSGPAVVQLKTEIQEKKMELYFVRHIIQVVENTYSIDDIETIDTEATLDNLWYEMRTRYVDKKEWTTVERLEELFADWAFRYAERLPVYQSCSDSPWQDVADEWNDLMETSTNLFEDLPSVVESNSNTQGIFDEFRAIKQEREEETGITAGGEKSGSAFGAYFDKHVDIRINNVTPPEGLNDIIAEAQENGQVVTIQDATEQLVYLQEQYDQASSKAQLQGKYTLLYKSGSAEMTDELVAKIELLQSIVINTTDQGDVSLNALAKATKAINQRQGKGSPFE